MHDPAIARAESVIESLRLSPEDYVPVAPSADVRIQGDASNVVLARPGLTARLSVNFGGARGCRLLLGAELQGSLQIGFSGDSSLVVIGERCVLHELQIRSKQAGDFIAIGNGVTTTAKNTWISGAGAGAARPWLIVGDDCMFAYDIVIRNSDAHPIYAIDGGRQLNEPASGVCLEPHVWVGEDVKILKDLTIGAGSIVAMGSIVTRDVPRASIARGIPAVATPAHGRYWARNDLPRSRERALHFHRRYPPSPS